MAKSDDLFKTLRKHGLRKRAARTRKARSRAR
jgi:hypothetical protein